jgi:hypothetical protein
MLPRLISKLLMAIDQIFVGSYFVFFDLTYAEWVGL